jgi:hypothetical protein
MASERGLYKSVRYDDESTSPSPGIGEAQSARRWNSARGSSSISICRRLRPPNDAHARRHRRRREQLGRAPDTPLLVSSAGRHVVLAWRHCRSPPPRPRTPLVPLRSSASRTSSGTRNCRGACIVPYRSPAAGCSLQSAGRVFTSFWILSDLVSSMIDL